MSYDLMVFAVDAAPTKRQDFLGWYEQQAQWQEGHAYDDAAVATTALRAFFNELVVDFPALGGNEDEAVGTDYTIGKSLIYMSFGWEQVDHAYEAVFRLAGKHALGFFDLSSDLGEVWLPDRKGGLRLAHAD